jgi:hypothetical protein
MGWNASSDVFNERMAAVTKGLPNTRHIVEDILVFSVTVQEHMRDVEELFKACHEHGVSLNTKKIQLLQTSVKFGGCVLSHGRYCIDPDLTADLWNFPPPTNRTALHSFMGLAQQLGNFTDAIACLLDPLRSLNTDNAAWQWLPEHQQAFERARKALASPPYLTFFNPARETELLCDASKMPRLCSPTTMRGGTVENSPVRLSLSGQA